MKALIIEDDKDLEYLYELQLKAAGIEAASVSSAQAALDLLETMRPDVILLDLMLPGYNGLSFLQELRSYEDWQNIPVLIISSLPLALVGLNKKLLNEFGIKAYLDKSAAKRADIIRAVEAAAT